MVIEIKRPKTVREAVRQKSAPGTAWLGGGTRLNAAPAGGPTVLISLENLGLRTIAAGRDRCTIGAAATFQQIVETDGVPPAIRAAASLTASRTLRNMTTLGGELGARPEDSSLIPALLALGAEVACAGRKKPVPIDDYCSERSSDLILSVSMGNAGRRCGVKAISRTSHSGKSLVVAVSVDASASTMRNIRIIVSDCRGQRVRLREVEKELEGAPLRDRRRIEELVGRAFEPRPDIHASAEYKRYMTGILVADTLHALTLENTT
jgi:putative selenate reductase FAD-binding subunit